MSENSKRVQVINWIALIIMMVFYACTWTFAGFYHITEVYNTLIIFAALAELTALHNHHVVVETDDEPLPAPAGKIAPFYFRL